MSSPLTPQPSQRLERLVDLCDRVLNGGEPLVRSPHIRHVWPARDVFYPKCSCGWVGTPFLFRETAQAVLCEVEMLLTDSAERARRILQG